MQLNSRFSLFTGLTLGIAALSSVAGAVEPDPTLNMEYLAAARKSVDKASTLVETMQDDIIGELAGDKEKSLFRLADQTQNEVGILHKTLLLQNPTRDELYKQFDRVDEKVSALIKATNELNPKRPTLERAVERIRIQNDDLHYLLSVGDESKERQREVLVRQAKSMKSAAKQFVVASEYAILDRPGRAPFIDAVKKFASKCESFETLARDGTLEQCKNDFASLTITWGEVVRGFRLLLPQEDYHIARLGFRTDQYHRRIFELLKMPGKRPQLTIVL